MIVKRKYLPYALWGGLLLLGGAQSAQAAATAAGTTISNIATVNYQVGGVNQTPIGSSPTGNTSGGGTPTTFLVDREIGVLVAQVGGTVVSVSPGQTQAVNTFTVTNTGNATQDFLLAGLNRSNGATSTAPNGTDNLDVSNIKVFVDTNGNGTYDAGTDTQVFVDELPAGSSKTVFIVADVPASATSGQQALVSLVAQAAQGGAGGTQGTAITNDDNGHVSPAGTYSNGATSVAAGTASTVADSATTVNTVFIDTAGDVSSTGAADTSSNGQHSKTGVYSVSSATLSVTKTATVISDPINGTSNPKAIPGATMQYTITVVNSGSANATSVKVTDPIPANTTYVAGSIKQNSTAQTDAGGDDNSDFNVTTAGAITSTFPTLSTSGAGATGTVSFQVTIN